MMATQNANVFVCLCARNDHGPITSSSDRVRNFSAVARRQKLWPFAAF